MESGLQFLVDIADYSYGKLGMWLEARGGVRAKLICATKTESKWIAGGRVRGSQIPTTDVQVTPFTCSGMHPLTGRGGIKRVTRQR